MRAAEGGKRVNRYWRLKRNMQTLHLNIQRNDEDSPYWRHAFFLMGSFRTIYRFDVAFLQ